ncbi:MAG TPA: hypothetical protein ENK62_04625 [Chromatiales bacterium]|nr:hypothetical protein [Chromatiales bacterium]
MSIDVQPHRDLTALLGGVPQNGPRGLEAPRSERASAVGDTERAGFRIPDVFIQLLEELLQRAAQGGGCACQAPQGPRQEPPATDPAPPQPGDRPATTTAPRVELPEGLETGDAPSGRLRVYRAPDATLPWDGLAAQRAVPQYWEAAMVPDARGLIGGQVAPGLEGWYELVAAGEDHNYHGYRDYLEQNYPGGYEAWQSAFDAYRRVALNGEELEFAITDTSGLRNGMSRMA